MNYYAGIGAQKTPEHILKIMHHCGAYLATQGWTLRSGFADGADKAFNAGVETVIDASPIDLGHTREIYLPWDHFNHAGDEPHFLSPKNHPFTDEEMALAAKAHPAWHKCSPSVRLLHQRNGRIMLGHPHWHGEDVTPVSFVVCWTENGAIKGGTGQALRIAQGLDIPVLNFGNCQSTEELEAMLLKLDEWQTKLKKDPVTNGL